MNKIFKALTSGKPLKEVKQKRTCPVILAFDNEAKCLGQINGSDINKAFEQFPTSTVLNIIPIRGRNKVVFRPS